MVKDREERQDADEVPDTHDVADGVGVPVFRFVWGDGGRERRGGRGREGEKEGSDKLQGRRGVVSSGRACHVSQTRTLWP